MTTPSITPIGSKTHVGLVDLQALVNRCQYVRDLAVLQQRGDQFWASVDRGRHMVRLHNASVIPDASQAVVKGVCHELAIGCAEWVAPQIAKTHAVGINVGQEPTLFSKGTHHWFDCVPNDEQSGEPSVGVDPSFALVEQISPSEGNPDPTMKGYHRQIRLAVSRLKQDLTAPWHIFPMMMNAKGTLAKIPLGRLSYFVDNDPQLHPVLLMLGFRRQHASDIPEPKLGVIGRPENPQLTPLEECAGLPVKAIEQHALVQWLLQKLRHDLNHRS